MGQCNTDGELIQDESRFDGDNDKAKQAYEEGMSRAFVSSGKILKPDGRMVVVFANKKPDAWETLVAAVIKAGFTVVGSWPIATEMRLRVAQLSESIACIFNLARL